MTRATTASILAFLCLGSLVSCSGATIDFRVGESVRLAISDPSCEPQKGRRFLQPTTSVTFRGDDYLFFVDSEGDLAESSLLRVATKRSARWTCGVVDDAFNRQSGVTFRVSSVAAVVRDDQLELFYIRHEIADPSTDATIDMSSFYAFDQMIVARQNSIPPTGGLLGTTLSREFEIGAGHLIHTTFDGSGWSGGEQLDGSPAPTPETGGAIASAIGGQLAVASADDGIHLFYTGERDVVGLPIAPNIRTAVYHARDDATVPGAGCAPTIDARTKEATGCVVVQDLDGGGVGRPTPPACGAESMGRLTGGMVAVDTTEDGLVVAYLDLQPKGSTLRLARLDLATGAWQCRDVFPGRRTRPVGPLALSVTAVGDTTHVFVLSALTGAVDDIVDRPGGVVRQRVIPSVATEADARVRSASMYFAPSVHSARCGSAILVAASGNGGVHVARVGQRMRDSSVVFAGRRPLEQADTMSVSGTRGLLGGLSIRDADGRTPAELEFDVTVRSVVCASGGEGS